MIASAPSVPADLEQRLLRCFRGVFPTLSDDEIRAADMRRLGRWDSATLLLLLARIEREFGVDVDCGQLGRATSFGLILERLQGATPASDRCTWLTVFAPRPSADVRLLCFPQAGSSAAAYGEWADKLSDRVELCVIEYPGRGRRRAERPFVRLHALVAAALRALRPELDRPFAVFGHCMGALVAFELLRQLHLEGGPSAVAFFAAGSAAPSRLPRRAPLYASPDDQLVAHLRTRGAIPEEWLNDSRVAELLLPPLRGDLEVVDTYLYRRRGAVRLRCPVFVLTGAADAEATVEETEAWDLETEQPPLVRRYDGDHRFLQTATASVLQDVASDLRAVRSAIYDVISQ